MVRERLHDLLNDEAPSAALRSARSVLTAAGRADAREARRVADETLRSERYLAVIDALQRLVADPPWTEESEQKASKVLPELIANDVKRMRKRVQAGRQGRRRRRADRAAARRAQGGQAAALRV